jgi:hypothetical protein
MSAMAHPRQLTPCFALLITVLISSFIVCAPQPVAAQSGWTQPVEISNDQFGWFPDLAADHTGTIHVIWGSGALNPNAPDPNDPEASMDLLRYRALRDGVWTPMNDIAFTCTGGYTVRNSLAVNADGRLQALVRTCFDMSTVSAPAANAGVASSWTPPLRLGTSYYNALATDSQGRLHAIYNEMVFGEPEQARLASEIFYRQSDDGGQTWSVRHNLANLPGGDERLQIAVDSRDRVHVVWDHGSDWYLGLDRPNYGIYRRSDDRGATWQPQQQLGVAGEPVYQTALALTNEGNPIVVYRSAASREIFYQISPDGGDTWNAAEPIPNVSAREDGSGSLDRYSLAVDSLNRVHLLMVGQPQDGYALIPMLLHLVWDGQRWSDPVIVAQGPNYVMWPRAVISMGNQLHVTWFAYTEVSDWGERRVWHSSTLLDSPAVAPPPLIDLAASAPVGADPLPDNAAVSAPVAAPVAANTNPQPAGSITFRDLPPPGAVGSRSDLAGIGLALAAVLGLMVLIFMLTLWRRAQ